MGPADDEDMVDSSVPPTAEADDPRPADELPGGSDGAPDQARVRRRRRTRSYVIGSIVGVVVAMLVAAAFIRLPYYRFAPGTLYATQPLISVDGAPTFADDGPIEFTTVSSKKVSLLELGLAKLDPAVEIVDADQVERGSTAEEIRQLNLEAMDDAKQIAEVVALRQLGYDIEVTGTGAVVRGVGPDTPADGVLEANDTIVAIDSAPITTAGEAVAAIGSHHPGDTVTIRVEPISPEGIKGAPRDEVVALGTRPDDDSQAMLGVSLGTRDTQFDLPVSIAIDSQDVGGPSAGLALTLGIMDVLTPGSLTGGNRVAVTGTMDLDGKVGRIGGIQQKTYLASRSGVRVFIVPADEADEARRFAEPDLQIIGVRTIDEAIDALAGLGGDTDVIEQAASATAGSTAPTGP